MKLDVCVIVLLLISLQTVGCRLPDFTPATPQLQVDMKSNVVPSVEKKTKDGLRRLPGLCRRLKRRRVTVLCNMEKYCWRGRSRGRSQKQQQSGQVCLCPRGSRCPHFFIHSL